MHTWIYIERPRKLYALNLHMNILISNLIAVVGSKFKEMQIPPDAPSSRALLRYTTHSLVIED